jgi:peptidoglycan/LPS O-acetylase OafA/YrhL
MKKFANIEFLRFSFIWAVVVYHIHTYIPATSAATANFSNGFYAVMAFFLFGGFFLFLKSHDVSNSIVDFAKDRWMRLAPVSIVLLALFLLILPTRNISTDILYVLQIGDWATLPRYGHIGHLWFINQLFLVSVAYFSLTKLLDKKISGLAIGLLTFIGLRFWAIGSPNNYFIHSGMGLALFIMGIGYFLAQIYYKEKQLATLPHKESIVKTICYTIAEIVLLFFIVVSMYKSGSHNAISQKMTYVCVVVLFWFFINSYGYLSRLLNKNWANILGRYTFSIYVFHVLCIEFVKIKLMPIYKDWMVSHVSYVVMIICVASMLLAVIMHHFVEVPVMRWWKNKRAAVAG